MSVMSQTAARYRNYAEELRTMVAEGPPNRHLLNAAQDYERMAHALEAIDRSTNAIQRTRTGG